MMEWQSFLYVIYDIYLNVYIPKSNWLISLANPTKWIQHLTLHTLWGSNKDSFRIRIFPGSGIVVSKSFQGMSMLCIMYDILKFNWFISLLFYPINYMHKFNLTSYTTFCIDTALKPVIWQPHLPFSHLF